MSFSHAEDLDIVAACLKRLRERGDLPYVGLIGSKTKWATFRHRLEERGFRKQELAQVTCPIGIPGITGKQPEVIAVAVAAQLLQSPLPEPRKLYTLSSTGRSGAEQARLSSAQSARGEQVLRGHETWKAISSTGPTCCCAGCT